MARDQESYSTILVISLFLLLSMNIPVETRPKVVRFHIKNVFVDLLCPLCNVFPVVEILDAFMRFEGVMLAALHNVDSFRDCTDDIWRVIKGLPTSCEG